MPASFHIDEARALVIGSATGVVTPAELIEAFSRLMVESGGRAASLPMLFKADERASHHAMDPAGLKSVKDDLRSWRASGPTTARVKNAFVVADPKHDPVPKLWKAMAEADPGMGIDVGIFPTEEAALAWLADDIA